MNEETKNMIDSLKELIYERFDRVEERLDGLEGEAGGQNGRTGNAEKGMAGLTVQRRQMDLQWEKVEKDVSTLKAGQEEMEQRLMDTDARLGDTYKLALENWGQIEEAKYRLDLLEQ